MIQKQNPLLEHFHRNKTKDAETLQSETTLPLSKKYRKLERLQEKGELKRKKESGLPSIFPGNIKKPKCQIALRNPT